MATANSKMYLDLDALVPDAKLVKLAGKEFDVSQLPLGLVVKVTKMQSRLKDSEEDAAGQLDVVIELVSDIFQVTDETATPEWVMSHLTLEQMIALVDFIGDSMASQIGAEDGSGGGQGEALGTQEH